MTELQRKNLIIQRDFIRHKEQELRNIIKELTKAPKTIHELDDIEFFITTNQLEKYV